MFLCRHYHNNRGKGFLSRDPDLNRGVVWSDFLILILLDVHGFFRDVDPDPLDRDPGLYRDKV